MSDDDTARDLLAEAARSVRWSIPEGASFEALVAHLRARLDRIEGGQDRAHAKNGLESAVESARAGNAELTRAGLWEAQKTLALVHR